MRKKVIEYEEVVIKGYHISVSIIQEEHLIRGKVKKIIMAHAKIQ